jgi:hypothetical protein
LWVEDFSFERTRGHLLGKRRPGITEKRLGEREDALEGEELFVVVGQGEMLEQKDAEEGMNASKTEQAIDGRLRNDGLRKIEDGFGPWRRLVLFVRAQR